MESCDFARFVLRIEEVKGLNLDWVANKFTPDFTLFKREKISRPQCSKFTHSLTTLNH